MGSVDLDIDAAVTIETILASKKIIVVLGPGGVGKTTSSISLAIQGAMLGKRVGLLSIDPAKRLASAMGITLGHDLKKIKLPTSISGEIHACMLDQAAVFDRMVEKFTSPEIKEKIFKNSVYQQASKNLGGPLEYMALAKLNEIVADNTFDLVVLDTPPDTHAIEFLVKPDILSGFVERGVMNWLIKPFHIAQKIGIGRVLHIGEKLMGGVAAVTGVKMLERLSEFLILMDSVIKGFHTSGQQIASKLRKPDTGFLVILAPVASSLRSGLNIQKQLHKEGFNLDAVIINRILPAWQKLALQSLDEEGPTSHESQHIFQRLRLKLDMTEKVISDLKSQQEVLFHQSFPIFGLSERESLVHSLPGIIALTKELAKAPQLNPDFSKK